MQIKFKDLGNKEFTLELQPSNTVLEAKQLVQQEKGFEVEKQKFIFKGKILKNEQTLEEAQVNEQGFVVLMVNRATKPLAKSAEATKPEPKEAEVKPEAKEETTVQTSQPLTTAAPTQTNEPASLVVGEQYESTVNNFLEMGFDREQIKQAMRAAFNNPERATEYLINGIPDELVAEFTNNQAPAVQPASQHVANSVDQNQDVEQPLSENLFDAALQQANRNQQQQGALDMEALLRERNNPEFQMIRRALQENPNLLQPFLENLGRSNPDLMNLIRTNPELLAVLLEDGPEGEFEEGEEGGQRYIQITQEENDAISRLEALGFGRERVIQAYFACDKNEELAANYLFDNQDDD